MYLLFLHIIFLASPPQRIIMCIIPIEGQLISSSVAPPPPPSSSVVPPHSTSITEVLSSIAEVLSIAEQHRGDDESSVTLGMDIYSALGEQSADLFGDVATAPVHQHEKSLQWKWVACNSSSGEESERMTKCMWHGSVVPVIPQTTLEESDVIEPPPLAQ